MTEWEDATTEQRKAMLRADEKLVFEDDLGHMFVTEDCGGDLNVHLFDLDGDAVTFASLNPPEVRRLLSVVTQRVAEYDQQ